MGQGQGRTGIDEGNQLIDMGGSGAAMGQVQVMRAVAWFMKAVLIALMSCRGSNGQGHGGRTGVDEGSRLIDTGGHDCSDGPQGRR